MSTPNYPQYPGNQYPPQQYPPQQPGPNPGPYPAHYPSPYNVAPPPPFPPWSYILFSGKGRINRGKRMCGHMGDEQVTVQNLKIVKIDLEKNVVLIEGAVPGGDNSLIIVRQSIKKLGKAMQKKKTAA